MERPANNPKKTKMITIELDLEDYWPVQDIQRDIESTRGFKRSIAAICVQLIKEATVARQKEAPDDRQIDK
ncbi:hypothetical protein [Xanthocytophaga agilis]|uniref:Uncharacterized protein n=1 Tax=Xanthocytophaga agilis TaxID=3048010 RepID=A0AAE3UD46_9BACT|nr:hypothetical protein [Xanthocytophaga agilis]MDJ1500820.1 hypothetical protein [Xanthocytophaga agilis]